MTLTASRGTRKGYEVLVGSSEGKRQLVRPGSKWRNKINGT
jgi:hypothetical protein